MKEPSSPPTKLLPWILGFLAGAGLVAVIGGILFLRATFADRPDAEMGIVAVSWGTPRSSDNLWLYQVQISATQPEGTEPLAISARVNLGRSDFFHDLGKIGTASDMGDAIARFGDIRWLDEAITIGGIGGAKVTVSRSELEKHR